MSERSGSFLRRTGAPRYWRSSGPFKDRCEAQPGCLACHIYEEQGAEPAIVLVERWETQSALEAHLRSEAYRRVLGAVELSGSPPEVSFDYVSATDGIELIERSRTPGARTAGR